MMKRFVFVFSLLFCLALGLKSVIVVDKEIEELSQTDLWNKCIDFPILGDSCLDLYANLNNLTLGLELTINNNTYLNVPLLEGTL